MTVDWIKKYPGRLRYEIEKLREAGFHFVLVKEDLKRGLVTLTGVVTINGESVHLRIKFPDSYPYFRCEFFADEWDLAHHQNPFAKNLCMLTRPTENWTPEDTVAALIQENLQDVLTTGRTESKEVAKELEEHQGEPITQYIHTYVPGPCVLFDSLWEVNKNAVSGSLIFGLAPGGRVDQWAIIRVLDEEGRVLENASSEIAGRYSEEIKGAWIRVKGRIQSAEPEALFKYITDLDPSAKYKPGLYGILVEEESSWRGKGDGWIFVKRLSKKEAREYKLDPKKPLLIRGMRSGQKDLQARTPELLALCDKKVLVVGLGCLGAPSALEFARSGVGVLKLLDFDIVEAGTISRWPIGIHAAGIPKAFYLEGFIKNNYPFCKTSTIPIRIGAVRGMAGSLPAKSDIKILEEEIIDIDLIYDASAEIGVQRFLSDLAWENSIPYVKVSGSPGMWGGEVMRVVRDQTKGCWLCVYKAQEDFDKPVPNCDPKGSIYPAGCGSTTFTGAFFDSNIIAMSGVRLAIATLLKGEGGYPDFSWDVTIINLRDKNGKPILPEFKQYPLDVYQKCPSGRH